MDEIKVLHCIHSLSWGGLEIYTTELVQKLAQAGVKQMVLCSAHSRVSEELRMAGVEVISFPGEKISKLAEARLIKKLIKKHGFTHLHSHTRLDMWACALALFGRKDIKHVYNLYMNARPKQDIVHRRLFSKVDALCSSSENILQDAKKNFPISPEKLRLIRYGRNTELYQHNPVTYKALREEFGVRPNQIVFGTLCRIDPGKGVRELVKALDYLNDQELSRTQLWIVGEPTILRKDSDGTTIYEAPSQELNDWIQEQAENPRNTQHLIRIPFQKEYISYLDAMNVFVLASYNETYSLSVLDAMMIGKPTIGTDAGGTSEQIVHNERGYLVEPKDAKSIAEAMRFYLRHPEIINVQGRKARNWSLQNHNWKNTVASFLDLYKSL